MMESSVHAPRQGAILSVLILSLASLSIGGCCSIDLNCGSGACSKSCRPNLATDPLFDGKLRHRVGQSVHSCANQIACTGGCGEVYWDEAIQDPAVTDRCEHQGLGAAACGSSSPWFGSMASLWGTPYRASCSASACSSGCNDDSCGKQGSCGQHSALVNHLRGHRGSIGSGLIDAIPTHRNHCPSCRRDSNAHVQDEVIYDGESYGESFDNGQTLSNPTPMQVPTPATPRASQESDSAAPSNAQNRMRLHQRSGQSDPNGRLSAQMVNGHKRLISTP
ncbi:MAG: hypothetical protein NTV29_15035 [Planctomycetota bacterium]|nr:hypothetical protein [Planctomycetota bacterium]